MEEYTAPGTITAEEELFEEDTMHNRFLVFTLDEQEYAIAIRFVTDIINIQPVTRVPNCPDYVKGVTNLRGKIIPIVDVRLRFGKELLDYGDRTCIIVVEERGATVGLIIDSVNEVITLTDANIAPPPPFNGSVEANFIEGIGKADSGIKLILDPIAVLEDEQFLPAAVDDEEEEH